MTGTIIIPNEPMVSVPVPPSYIGKEVEVTFALVNGASKTAFREQQILESNLSVFDLTPRLSAYFLV